MKRRPIDPPTRVGICCGDLCRETLANQVLYKIPGIFRYRCIECYRKECGCNP